MAVGAAEIFSSASTTMGAGSWATVLMGTSGHEDAATWTVDLANEMITQDGAATVVVVGRAHGNLSTDGGSFMLRMERDTGGGFAAITGTETRQYDASAGTVAGAVAEQCITFGAFAGSAGDDYRIAAREDATGTGTVDNIVGGAGGIIGFVAPGPVCWAIGASDVEGSATYTDVTLTTTGGLLETGYSAISGDAITLPWTVKYLILYRVRYERDSGSEAQVSARLAQATGGAYSAIARSEVWGTSGANAGSTDGGSSVFGAIVYAGTANETIKLQFTTDGTTCDMIAEGSSIMVIALPAGWHGFSGTEATAATPPTAGGTTLDMDTEIYLSGFTHSAGTVTGPAASYTALMLHTYSAQDNSGSGGITARMMVAGTARIGGYGNADTAAALKLTTAGMRVRANASGDTIAIQGWVSADPAAVNYSGLQVLRLDDMPAWSPPISASVGLALAVTAPPKAFGRMTAAATLALALAAPPKAIGRMASSVALDLAVTAPAYAWAHVGAAVSLDLAVTAATAADEAMAASIGLALGTSGTLTGLGRMTSAVALGLGTSGTLTALGRMTASLALALDVTAPGYAVGWIASSLGVAWSVSALEGDIPIQYLTATVQIGHVVASDVEVAALLTASPHIAHILTADPEVL